MTSRLLIIDDEPAVLRCLERCLRGRYEITTVERADAAMILLKKRHFDVILADIDMPGLRGDELVCLLPENIASRVVLMSGRWYDENEERILAKPLSLERLVERLDFVAAA